MRRAAPEVYLQACLCLDCLRRVNLEGASVWAGRTVSNTRNGMDAHGWSTQPPAPSFQQAGSPEPLAGGISDEMLKPVLEGLGNQTNACKKKPPQMLGV